MAGESREVQALRTFMDSTGIAHRVTSTTGGRHSPSSRHYAQGTGGVGLAVDLAGPEPMGTAAMLRIYRALLERADQLHELIFWCPPETKVLVRRRVRVVPTVFRSVLEAHRNHVHVSVDRGVFLEPLPPREPAAIQALVPPRVTDHPEEPMRRFDLEIALDDQGRGHTPQPLDFPAATVVSIVGHGPNPPTDGWAWPLPKFARQDRDGGTMVTVTDGPPGRAVPVTIWTSP